MNRSFLERTVVVLALVAATAVGTAVVTAPAQAAPGTTTVSATKTMTAHLVATHPWTLSKTASPTSLVLARDARADVTYTVGATRLAPKFGATFDGSVCVTNNGTAPTQGLRITDSLTRPPSKGVLATAEVSTAVHPVLTGGERFCYPYQLLLPAGAVPGAGYKDTATVTITNKSGSNGSAPSTTATLPTTPETVHNQKLTVADSNGDTFTFDQSGTTSYSQTYACPEDHGAQVNTVTAQAFVTAADVAAPTARSATVGVTCPNEDLSLTKRADAASVSAGQDVGFTLVAFNGGTAPATGVIIHDPLASRVTWSLAPSAPSGCQIADSELTCDLGTLVSGASATVHVVGVTDADDCGELTNTATVTATDAASATKNDVATDTVVIDCPQLTVAATPDADTVDAGNAAGVAFMVTNAGSGAASGVELDAALPAGQAWTLEPAVEGCSIADDVLSCSFGTLAPDGHASVHASTATTPQDCAKQVISTSVSAANEPVSAQGDDTTEAVVTVECPDIGIKKTADTESVDAGSDVGFSLLVTNTGSGSAHGVSISDPLPAGLEWDLVPALEGCGIAQGSLTCDLGTVAPGGSVTAHVSAATTETDCGLISNTATVSATNEPQSATGDDVSTAETVVVCPDQPAAPSGSLGDDPPLTNGVPLTGLSGATGSSTIYTLEVPTGASALSFKMSGGTGDADMYVRFGAEPTTTTYDCRPYLNGNNETCSVANVQVGTYYVMLRAYTAYSGVTLTGAFTAPVAPQQLENGVPVSVPATATAGSVSYTMAVPAGASGLSLKIAGGTGDADLYVKFGAAPTTSSYDCRPYLSGSTETCSFAAPQAGTYYVMVRAYAAFSAVTLTGAFSTPAVPSALQNGVPSSVPATQTGGAQTFTLAVPEGATGLSFKLTGGTGDADLYVKFGAAPTTSSYDCRPYLSGSTETCSFVTAQTGTYYVMVRAYATFSGVTLLAGFSAGGAASTLQSGVPVSVPATSTGASASYTMAVPAGAFGLSFKISGGTGDADLYVKFGTAPTTSSYDCRPYLSGNTETCSFATPQTGTYYVMVRAYASFSGVSLVASYGSGGAASTLQSGVPVSVPATSTGASASYTMAVPAGASGLSFKISGGTGDADLYVKFGTAPTTSSYDCRPYLSGNTETCSFTTPQTGTYYVMVRAYASFSGVTLVASYGSGGAASTLQSGVPVSVPATSTGGSTSYTMAVPAGASGLSFKISGGTGDADLYVKFGSAPTTSSFGCRPYLSGNTETCSFATPQAGTYYVMVRAYASFSGVTLLATYTPAP